jgi:hypothetical protein
LLIAAALVLAGASGGVAQAATPGHHPLAELTHFACRVAQNPQHRELAITAIMRHEQGTAHMAIRFELERESPGAQAFAPVRGGDLDHWISPKDATLGQRVGDVWKLAKTVSDLAGPAVYRLRVEFRWTDAHHRVLLLTHRYTPVCRAD